VDELDLARELADIADEISMRYFGANPFFESKVDGTLVTVADREIEQALRRRIESRFPEHALVGEEEGSAGDPSAPTWVIDPIDATNNYAWGIPIFATLVALRVEGRSEIGIASAPALRERYEAARGGGAFMNGSPVTVTDVASIEEARVCYGSHAGIMHDLGDGWREVLRDCRRERGFGDFWGHVLVARGAAEVMAEPAVALWDVAALQVIIEEAGGRITQFNGDPHPADWGPGYLTSLTTNGRLHDKLVQRLAG
jgi:histidinol-phosphatase